MIRESVFKILIISLLLTFISSAISKEKEDLYYDIIDRVNSESFILGKIESGSYKIENINKVYGKGKIMEDSSLRVAVFRELEEVVEFLLDHGADPNVKLKNNCSVLGTAISNANDRLVKTLLDSGADSGLPMCWPEYTERRIRMDNAIVQYDLEDKTRMEFMKAHVRNGGELSQRLLSFSIFNNKPQIAELYVKLMPEFRDQKLMAMAKSRSPAIFNILKENWNK